MNLFSNADGGKGELKKIRVWKRKGQFDRSKAVEK